MRHLLLVVSSITSQDLLSADNMLLRCVAMGLLPPFWLPAPLPLTEHKPAAIMLGHPIIFKLLHQHLQSCFKATTLQPALCHVAVTSVPLMPPATGEQIILLLRSQSAIVPILHMSETAFLSLLSLSLTSAPCRQPGAGLAGGEELMAYLQESQMSKL